MFTWFIASMRSAKTRPTIRYLFDHHRADSITLNRYIESLSMPLFFLFKSMHKATIFRNPIYICIMTNERHTSIHSQRQTYGKIEFQIAHSLWIEFRNDFNRKVFMWRSQKKKISRALSLYVLQKISFGMAFLTHLTHARNSCCVVYIFSLLCFHCIKWPLFLFLYTNTKKDVVDVYLRVCWCFLCWYVGSEFCFWNAFPNCSLWREFVVTGYLYESLTVTTTRMCVVFHLLFLSLLSNCAH